MTDDDAMALALESARAAAAAGEIPIGAVVVRGDQVIARAHNLRESLNDPTAHAERIALGLAGRVLGSWRLEGCTLYSTLEPCAMCAGAIVLARVPRLVYGATDPKAGACTSLYRIASDPRLNHRATITGGILADDCRRVLSEFFADRRRHRTTDRPSEGCLSG